MFDQIFLGQRCLRGVLFLRVHKAGGFVKRGYHPSALAVLRRPFIYTRPPARAIVGQKLEYRAATLLSIGDLRSRTFDPQHIYNASFWDRDEPRFHLLFGPRWLTIDRATGLVSGTPSAKDVGKLKVGILADIPKVATDTQQFELEVVAKP